MMGLDWGLSLSAVKRTLAACAEAGAGTLRATDEAQEIADLLQAGVAKAIVCKADVPESVPTVTGVFGCLETKPRYGPLGW